MTVHVIQFQGQSLARADCGNCGAAFLLPYGGADAHPRSVPCLDCGQQAKLKETEAA